MCRVYSLRNMGPKGDLTLDMGAYRYMPLAQPLITDIVERLLKLPNRLYQVSSVLQLEPKANSHKVHSLSTLVQFSFPFLGSSCSSVTPV